MREKNTPVEPGLYLASSMEDDNYDLLVYIYGITPFLKWHVWEYRKNREAVYYDLSFIRFSSKIAMNIDRFLEPLDNPSQ